MALGQHATREALREANDWLVMAGLPGGGAAQEGIANVIGMLMMDAVAPESVDELAALVLEYSRAADDPEAAEAVRSAFDHVKSTSPEAGG